jgi:hypothetical protein
MNVTISQLLKSIAETLSVPNVFIYGKKGFQNLMADEALALTENNCLIFLDEPISSEDNFTQGGAVQTKYKINMMFAQKSQFDWTFEQHDDVVSQMRSASRDFILRLLASINPDDGSHNIKSVANVNRTNVQNIFDVNLSGVLCSFNIIPFNDDAICIANIEPAIVLSEFNQTCNVDKSLNIEFVGDYEFATDYGFITPQVQIPDISDEWFSGDAVPISVENDDFSLPFNIGGDIQGVPNVNFRMLLSGDGVDDVYSNIITQNMLDCGLETSIEILSIVDDIITVDVVLGFPFDFAPENYYRVDYSIDNTIYNEFGFSAGIPDPPFTGENTLEQQPLPTGWYIVRIKDEDGNVVPSEPFYFESPNPSSIDFQTIVESCNEDGTQHYTFNFNVVDGSGNYEVQIFVGAAWFMFASFGSVFNGDGTGGVDFANGVWLVGDY